MDLCTVQLDTSFCSMALFICQDFSVYFLKLKIEYTVNIMLYDILQKNLFLKRFIV